MDPRIAELADADGDGFSNRDRYAAPRRHAIRRATRAGRPIPT